MRLSKNKQIWYQRMKQPKFTQTSNLFGYYNQSGWPNRDRPQLRVFRKKNMDYSDKQIGDTTRQGWSFSKQHTDDDKTSIRWFEKLPGEIVKWTNKRTEVVGTKWETGKKRLIKAVECWHFKTGDVCCTSTANLQSTLPPDHHCPFPLTLVRKISRVNKKIPIIDRNWTAYIGT